MQVYWTLSLCANSIFKKNWENYCHVNKRIVSVIWSGEWWNSPFHSPFHRHPVLLFLFTANFVFFFCCFAAIDRYVSTRIRINIVIHKTKFLKYTLEKGFAVTSRQKLVNRKKLNKKSNRTKQLKSKRWNKKWRSVETSKCCSLFARLLMWILLFLFRKYEVWNLGNCQLITLDCIINKFIKYWKKMFSFHKPRVYRSTDGE